MAAWGNGESVVGRPSSWTCRRPGCGRTPCRVVRLRRARVVRAGFTDHARPLRRVDVHRRSPGAALPIDASAGDGRRRPALRLPPRSMGPAATHRRLSSRRPRSGRRREAQRAVDVVRRVHDHVTGVASDGRPYSANDPHLLRWVHLAELDSFLAAHDRYGADPLVGARPRSLRRRGRRGRPRPRRAGAARDRAGAARSAAFVPLRVARHDRGPRRRPLPARSSRRCRSPPARRTA